MKFSYPGNSKKIIFLTLGEGSPDAVLGPFGSFLGKKAFLEQIPIKIKVCYLLKARFSQVGL